MAKEDLSETAAQAAEQNMEKARGAMDNYFSFLQNIWGSNDLTEKMKTYTQLNISAYADCVANRAPAGLPPLPLALAAIGLDNGEKRDRYCGSCSFAAFCANFSASSSCYYLRDCRVVLVRSLLSEL